VNKATTILLGLSVLILAGAFALSRALLSDIPVPPPPVLPTPPVVIAPPPPAPAPSAPAVVQPPPLPTDVAVVAPPPPEAPVAAAPPPPPANDSDYAREDSPQVEEAWRLARTKDVAGWRAAEKLFKRCLVQAPDNQRCQSGLAAVQGQLSQADTRPLQETPPTPKYPRPRHDKNYVE